MDKLIKEFYDDDAVTVARRLLGKVLVRRWEDGTETRYRITMTEAYMGEEDKACHARKGRTSRTEIMYASGGFVYVYLIYGMYWMLNVVTGKELHPQAVLICGIENIAGSGRVGRELKLNKSFYGEDLQHSHRIWIEDAPDVPGFVALPRVGIDYAETEWKEKPWRFIAEF